VGKSSLINALLGRRKLVRVSRTPGCTRGINIYRVKLSQGFVDLADLPGYGFAKRSKAERRAWGPLIEGFLQTRSNLRAVVVIVDIRRGIQEDDQQLLDFVGSAKQSAIVVATKCDKLSRSKRKPALTALNRDAGHRVHGFSAVTGEGRAELLSALVEIAFGP
jgi:GTP-binding protein